MKDAIISKTKNLISSANVKVAIFTSIMLTTVIPTFCETGFAAFDNVDNLLFEIIGKWAGRIIAVVGVIMLGRTYIESQGDNAHTGSIGRGIAVLIFGILLWNAKNIMTLLGMG